MEVASTPLRRDRWLWWPAASTSAMVAFFAFIGGLPGPLNLHLSLLAVVACPVVTLLLVGWTCLLLFRQLSRKAVSALLAVAIPALLLFPIAFAQPYVHLGLMLAFGIGYIGPTPDAGQPVGIYD